MALDGFSIEVTSVTESMPGQNLVTWELTLLDGATPLESRSFSQDFKKGDDVSRIETGFVKEMQKYIEAYKTSQVIFNHAKMGEAVTNVTALLVI